MDGRSSQQTKSMSMTGWASLIGGGVATVAGMRRGGKTGLLMSAVGGVLAYQGLKQRQSGKPSQTQVMQLRSAITIDRSASELYDYWHGFTRLPKIMKFLEDVQPRGGNRTHWVAAGPMNVRLEWDAEVTQDVPNERIGWRSVSGDLPNWGEVQFRKAPGDRGTEVRLHMHYQPPGGAVGHVAARYLNGLSDAVVDEDLRRFKRIMETGENATNAMAQ